MKKKINFICILILLALGTSVSFNIMESIKGSIHAWEMMQNKPEGSAEMDESIYTIIPLMPERTTFHVDSLFNEKSQKYIPVQYSEIIAQVDEPTYSEQMTIIYIITSAMILTMLYALYAFIRLIIRINHAEIFSWNNVKLLRRIGGTILAIFLLNLLLHYFNFVHLKELFSFKGYLVEWSNRVEILQLIIGLACFLFAEIFAMGLKIKEEQDLTI